MQRKPQKGAQCRRTKETAAHQLRGDFMYITEKMMYNKEFGRVELTLIWKTPNNTFTDDVYRYVNGKAVAYLSPVQFSYSRRGDFLIARTRGDPVDYPLHWKGIGEWRIDPKIRGNVRGCV